MTVAVAFEPHQDDVALFCAFEAQRLNAHVITVLSSQVQADRGLAITQQQRFHENDCAMRELGLSWEQWLNPDSQPNWSHMELAMRRVDAEMAPAVVLAPAIELGGHEQHTHVGVLAESIFGVRVRPYMTYVRGCTRTTAGREVEATADQIARKLRALACYRTQIAEPSTRPWFLVGIQEYVET